jgi:hypothetical protein
MEAINQSKWVSGKPIHASLGVRYGDTLSPIIFNIVLGADTVIL